MINHREKINCRAFMNEKFSPHFWHKTFSAESQSKQSFRLVLYGRRFLTRGLDFEDTMLEFRDGIWLLSKDS
jgi:hypothetical protein